MGGRITSLISCTLYFPTINLAHESVSSPPRQHHRHNTNPTTPLLPHHHYPLLQRLGIVVRLCQELGDADDAERDGPVHGTRVPSGAQDHKLIRSVLRNKECPAIGIHLGGFPSHPTIRLASVAVGEYVRVVVVADDDGAVDAADGAPDNIRARPGLAAFDDDGVAAVIVKLERRVGEAVVDGELLVAPLVAAGGAEVGRACFASATYPAASPGFHFKFTRIFIYKNPFVHGRDVSDDGHAGPVRIGLVGDVVDDGAPGLEVRRLLVGQLLGVLGIALVRVKDANGAVVRPGTPVLAGEQRHILGMAHRMYGSQMQGLPFSVLGPLPRATLLRNFHV